MNERSSEVGVVPQKKTEREAWLSFLLQIFELCLEHWILEQCNWLRSANSEQSHTHVARGVSEDFN